MPKTISALSQPKFPTIFQRFLASAYEVVLLFGMSFLFVAIIAFIQSALNTHFPQLTLVVIYFLLFGFYFTYCWSKLGHTLAQRTWKIQLTKMNHSKITPRQAWLRYVFSYIGFLPALVIITGLLKSNSELYHSAYFYLSAVLGIAFNWLSLLGTSKLDAFQRPLHEKWSQTLSTEFNPATQNIKQQS